MRTVVILVLVAGCSSEGLPGPDGGGDLGHDGGGAFGGDFFCTTADCAAAPCTPGCVFDLPPSDTMCPHADRQSLVAITDATTCARFCGRFSTESGGLGCGVYNGSLDGCQTCGFRWGAASCVQLAPMADYYGGGAICGDDSCFDGRPPPDASANPPCDTPDAWVRD